jgi:hypothetical protein
MLRSTALGLNRGLNRDRGGKKAYAFQRNLAMRSVPNPRGLCSGQPPVSHIEAHLASARTKDGQQTKEQLSVGCSSRMTKLEETLVSLGRSLASNNTQARAEAQAVEAKLEAIGAKLDAVEAKLEPTVGDARKYHLLNRFRLDR